MVWVANPEGKGGRIAGSVNRDRVELRALIQEKVHEFTELRRAKDIEDGLPPDQCQEIIDDYDPVVSLAVIAADRRVTLDQRMKCHDSVAQYVRPKLKSVDMNVDPEALEALESRTALSNQLLKLLEAGARAKKDSAKSSGPETES